jgi:hypothetical protein
VCPLAVDVWLEHHLKKLLLVLPLCAAFVSGCEYIKSPSPVHPSSLHQEPGSTQGPAQAPVYPSNGPDLVAYVVERYPERLVGGISLDERVENMRFLRDRMIEAGICGGMSLGWNLKRGGPEKSNDFLAWRREDGDMGVDIGFDYDNAAAPLRLQWLEAGMGATYTEFPTPSCQ